VDSLDAVLATSEYAHDPHPGNHLLRTEDPVHWSEAWDSWVPTRYEDTHAVLDDIARFTNLEVSALRVQRLLERVVPEPERSELLEFWQFGGLFQADPPELRRYRGLMTKALSARLVGIDQRVQQILDGLLKPALEGESLDIVHDVAYPLPEAIIFELIGVDEDFQAEFRRWTASIVLATSDPTGQAAMQSAKDLREAYGWLRDVVKSRRNDPRQDIISVLVNSADFGAMPERDLLATIVLLMVAGHETTANLISSGMYELIRNPAMLEDLRSDPTIMGSAVEEFLRFESPIQVTWRRARVDVEVGSKVIEAGQLVAVMHGAANRDPAQFQQPDICDIRRAPNPHVAFGHGAHFCLGAPLSRIEAPIVIRTLIERMRNIQIERDPEWRANTTFRGLESLQVSFEPVSVRA
jgi:cytochrome P450